MHVPVYAGLIYSSFKGGEVDAVDLFRLRDHTGGAEHPGGPLIHGTDL